MIKENENYENVTENESKKHAVTGKFQNGK